MNKKDYKKLSPFKGWVIQNFPYIEEDFDAITDYQLYCKIVEYLNKVIYNQNLLDEANNELIDSFNDLKNYVDNYFNTLDLQDEVDDKINEMVESGEFETLLNNYFNPNFKIIIPKNFENVDIGDIILLKVYDKNIVIDTHRSEALSDVVDFLDRNNISKIDYMILSHYHNDHVGNFVSLVNEGYIDENSFVYLPGYSSLIENDETTLGYYNSVNDTITTNNIPHIVPSEGDTLTIEDFKITFYNCETAIFQTMGVTNYNDCSTVCLAEYGDQKVLFTGDITDKPFKRFTDNQIFNYKIDIYKLEHHGNNINDEDVTFLEQITPSLALHTATSYSIELGRCSRSNGLAYMMMNNIPIYSQFNNTDDIEFNVYKDRYNLVKGKQNYSQAGYGIVNTYTVDAATTNTIQNGSTTYPFKSLAQALGKIGKIQYARNIINCKAGTYTFPTKQYVSGADITINGVSGNIPAVVVDGELIFHNCNVTLNNLTITNNNNYDGIDFQSSNVVVNKCNIYAPDETLSTKNGITSFKSMLTIRDTTISYYTNAIQTQYDLSYYNTLTISHCTTAFSQNRSRFSRFNITYTSVTNQLTGTNYVEIENKTKSEIIFNTSTATTEGTEMTLSKNFVTYNKLIISVGNISDGTWESILVNCYDNDYFRNTQKYLIVTSTGSFVISTSNNNKLTIDSNNDNTQNIRQIIGINS